MTWAWLTLVLCAAAHGQAQAPPQTPAAPAPSKGSITGQVVNAKTGAPLRKASIRLTPVMTGGQVAGAPQPSIRSADTDDQGRFSFSGLDAGKYRLAAERQGFLRQSYGERKYSGGGTPVLVADGQEVKGLLFRLNPQGVITGKVLDEDGEPLANVQVRAMRYLYANGKRQWMQVQNANSSDIGEYRLADLQPGRYLVSTNPRNVGRNMVMQSNEALPQTPDLTYATTYYPSASDSTAAIPVDVGAGGEIHGIDIRLVKTRAWRVRGKVSGPGGERGRGAIQVVLIPAEGPVNNPLMSMARPPDGQFEIRSVPAGSYTLRASSQAGGQVYAAETPVQVTGNHVDGITLVLASGGDVQGTVKLVDADAPVDLRNVSVMLRPVGFMGIGGPPQRARVGDDLKFAIKGVPPAKFAVNVSGIPNTCYVKSVQFGGRDVTAAGLDMSAGGALEVVISAAAAEVDAVVVDKDGKAAINAVVAVVPGDGSTPMVRTTDENGILAVKGLKPGNYKLVAWEDVEQGAPLDPDFLRQFEKQMKAVKLDAAGHEAVQLTAIAGEG